METRCSRVSALQTTFAVNTPIISDSLRLSIETWVHLERKSEEETLDARWERGDNYWRKEAFTKNKYLKCTWKFI